MGKIYGYARCSTDESKQDIQRQVRELKECGATKETIFLEYESGCNTNRSQFNLLMNLVEAGDTIVATELSRFTRSTKQLCDILEFVQENHLRLLIGKFEVDCSTSKIDPMTAGMLRMMGVFAELERDMISQRVVSGMRNAKAKGVVLGRPKVTADHVPPIFLKHYPKYKSHSINMTEFARLCDMNRTTIYKYVALVEAG